MVFQILTPLGTGLTLLRPARRKEFGKEIADAAVSGSPSVAAGIESRETPSLRESIPRVYACTLSIETMAVVESPLLGGRSGPDRLPVPP
jgi:hypothetical protein